MGNTHISNEVLPPEQRIVNEYPDADARLQAVINYLDDSLLSMRQRRAYIAPPGRWYLKSPKPSKASQSRFVARLIIEKNYYAKMGGATVEQLDEDLGWKPQARPNITCELAWACDLGPDTRSTDSLKREEINYKEGQLVEMRRQGDFQKINLQVIGDGVFEITEQAYEYLNDKGKNKAIWFEQSVAVIRKKREFADMLLNRPGRQHEPLKQILEAAYVFEPSPQKSLSEDRWIDLTDSSIMGTEQQREFVEKALYGKDFTIVWGPAGSGKTTAICEFIKQAIRDNKKVLMVGSTHIAVDNVLEKFARGQAKLTNDDEPGVIAVRVGRPAKVSEQVRPLLMENFLETKRNEMWQHLKPLADSKTLDAPAARSMLKCLEENFDSTPSGIADDIVTKILMSANLVCGTTIGILQHPIVQQARETGTYPNFDYLILDEASKTTLDEFIVPAMCAKRWIIVGDPYQLAPFCEEAELGATLLSSIMETASKQSPEMPQDSLAKSESPKVRKLLQTAIQKALQERAVRFQEDAFTKKTLVDRSAALNLLSETKIINRQGEIVSLQEHAELNFAIALPSILESLIGPAEGLPSARSIVRPLKEGLESRIVKLKYQHRMPKHLSDFAKNYVYKGRMLLTPENAKEKPRLHSQELGCEGRLVVLTAENSSENNPNYIGGERESSNQLVLAVKELLDFAAWAKTHPRPPDQDRWRAYLISTYKDQNRLCRKLVDHLYDAYGDSFNNVDIEANTVDSCQGHEADLVILTLVRDKQTPFMRSLNRMNVAFTRAKSRMVIVGDLPARTHEAIETGQACTMLDALHDYPVTRLETKNLEQALDIVNQALAS